MPIKFLREVCLHQDPKHGAVSLPLDRDHHPIPCSICQEGARVYPTTVDKQVNSE